MEPVRKSPGGDGFRSRSPEAPIPSPKSPSGSGIRDTRTAIMPNASMPPSPIASTDNLFRNFLRAIFRHNMLDAGDRVLVALSGGPDSVALLHLLLRIAPERSLRLGVAHLHHGLRGAEADRDAAFVADMAGKLALPFHGERRDADAVRRREKLSPEEAARRVRYDFLASVKEAEGYDRVALGHQADDNAETVLMRLIRGAGPAGTAGMVPVRPDGFIRPLLYAGREEILAFLEAEKIPRMADSSNADERFLRNRIRKRLLPLLRRDFNPGMVAALNRYAEIRRDEEAWLAEVAADLTDRCTLRTEDGIPVLSVVALRELPLAARRRTIRTALERVRGHLRRISMGHVASILDLLDGDGRHRRLDLPNRIRAVRTGWELRFVPLAGNPRECRESPIRYAYRMDGPGLLPIPEIGGRLSVVEVPKPALRDVRGAGQSVAFFDMRKVGFPLIVRNARPGDRFTPSGMAGTRKVADFFADRKVPAPDRSRCPVLLSGDRIVWVVGYRIDEAVKLAPSTENALKAEIFLV